MKDRYEISLWEDYPDTTANNIPFLNERKLCVIGSDSMNTCARALEPKMVANVNGTHTFTFKMFYTYIDEFTGESYQNPFLSLLINERKVKVLWKGEWYDMLIKDIAEDSAGKSATYTCQDLFITELSKNGYNLEFTSDLQNNSGTAADLTEKVLKGSGWQFDRYNSTTIIQKSEEPVYEVTLFTTINATKQSPNGDVSAVIPVGSKVLIFYSSVINKTGNVDVQFWYAANGYTTEENEQLVLNGDCYTVNLNIEQILDSDGSVSYIKLLNGGNSICTINTKVGISTRYRANRYVKSQISEYDKLLDRYVDVYTDSEADNRKVYGYSTSEFTDPLAVTNLVVNSSNFTNVSGWDTEGDLSFELYPHLERDTQIETYNPKSYLKIPVGTYIYNSAISSNQQYFKPSQGDIKRGELGGLQVGDKLIFRIKYKRDLNEGYGDLVEYVHATLATYTYTEEQGYTPDTYYTRITDRVINEDWVELTLNCVKSCPADQIPSLGLLIFVSNDVFENYSSNTSTLYIEEAQLFKYAIGVTSYEEGAPYQRINPGEISLQGIEETVYKYYYADHDGITDANKLVFLYEGKNPSPRFIPVTNNYEKIATIEAKNSNRFNILQSIAESFKCWVRFTINHDNTGRIIFDAAGLPQKYVTLVEYIGKDLGWSFEYGIDLKLIRRKTISTDLSTKVIVLPNDNEFAQNGFCSIARAGLNYIKENFILNFDYYVNQGLLNKDIVNKDLYSTSQEYIGYYYWLNKYNTEYDKITTLLSQKEMDLTKQQSQLDVVSAQLNAEREQLQNCKSDIMVLACTDVWESEEEYDALDYVREHTDNTKVQSLMNSISQIRQAIHQNESKKSQLEASIAQLTAFIDEKIERQSTLVQLTSDLHDAFFKKYSRYIQEGTWQSKDYVDDNKYYLDALEVAYTSSRPRLQYEINVMRLTALEDFSSKTFNTGDICYIQDKEFFGYGDDGVTPYKLQIVISEITSYFDSPEKDTIKVQNYKSQFDDLFKRIVATTQSLQYAQGQYNRAASVINTDKTLSFDLLQDTFDYNENLVLNASNQQVTWDSTGITITDDRDAALRLRMMAGGIFVTNDGGQTWKNAVRGDGISADVLTAGRINTSEIYIYDGAHSSFRWDNTGINAYFTDQSSVDFGKYVRFDRFGIYGCSEETDEPNSEDAIWEDLKIKFGLTWKGFFLRGSSNNSKLEISDDGENVKFLMKKGSENEGASLEISTDNTILLKQIINGQEIDRIHIGGEADMNNQTIYGLWIRDNDGNIVFSADSTGQNKIGGWNIVNGGLSSGNVTINSSGDLECKISNDTKWKLDHEGNIFAKSGTIAGWNISANSISNGNTSLTSNPTGDAHNITTDDLYATGGGIGGWTIGTSTLTGGSVTLNSSGKLVIGDIEISGSNNASIKFGSDASVTHIGTILSISPGLRINNGYIYMDSESFTSTDIGHWNSCYNAFADWHPVYASPDATSSIVGYVHI